MDSIHQIILICGGLGLLSIFVGVFSARFGAPVLLVFLVLGMLAGEDGPGGVPFDDFGLAYLVGSIALASILFEGGLQTQRAMIKRALFPSLGLATIGVAITAGLTGAAVVWLTDLSWPPALLIGAAVAPTDAAAVSVLLRRSGVKLPESIAAVLEVESGLNDPMSVFLTIILVDWMTLQGGLTPLHALGLFAEEVVGGIAIGAAGGTALAWLIRRISMESGLYPVLAIAAALALFGGAQELGASGFLAVYLSGVIVGNDGSPHVPGIERFFEALGWLAQISLFLMLGLLVNPHELVPVLIPAAGIAAALIFIARPVASFACLLPFRFPARHTAFISWVGLRGAVPIYLAIIPVLSGVKEGAVLFGVVFVIVIAGLIVQGWTIKPAAKLFRVEE